MDNNGGKMQVLKEAIRNKILQAAEEVGEKGSDNFNRIGKLQMSELLLEHKKLVILMDKAAGTKFVDSRVDITKRLQKTIKKKIEGYSENKYDESLYYLISCTFIEGVLEIARGYKNAKWAKNMMSLLMQCHFLGVQSL